MDLGFGCFEFEFCYNGGAPLSPYVGASVAAAVNDRESCWLLLSMATNHAFFPPALVLHHCHRLLLSWWCRKGRKERERGKGKGERGRSVMTSTKCRPVSLEREREVDGGYRRKKKRQSQHKICSRLRVHKKYIIFHIKSWFSYFSWVLKTIYFPNGSIKTQVSLLIKLNIYLFIFYDLA